MEKLEPITSLTSLVLDLPPSCAQFCPAHPTYLVIGTYNLERDEKPDEKTAVGGTETDADGPQDAANPKHQNRNGTLVVFKLEGNELIKVQTLSQPSALLDLRFYQELPGYEDILAVVSSTGTLAIFKLDPNDHGKAPLQHIATSRCDDLAADVLFLQCNWHPALTRVIGVTTSTGLARLLYLSENWTITSSADLDIGNSLEAWCIAFAPKSQNGDMISVYCGGDDSVLRYTACQENVDADDGLSALYGSVSVKSQHDAGVTAILPLPIKAPNGGRIVITGSYDDCLRVFAIHDLQDTYGMKRVELLAEENLGGGVWRLNLIDSQHQDNNSIHIRLLATCMYAGARLVEITMQDGERWACNVLARFEEHKSMNYASDVVSSSVGEAEGLRIVSTSFYDKLVCLW